MHKCLTGRAPEYLAEYCRQAGTRRPGMRSAGVLRCSTLRVQELHYVTDHLPSPAHVSGTACQPAFVTRHCPQEHSQHCWKLTCLMNGYDMMIWYITSYVTADSIWCSHFAYLHNNNGNCCSLKCTWQHTNNVENVKHQSHIIMPKVRNPQGRQFLPELGRVHSHFPFPSFFSPPLLPLSPTCPPPFPFFFLSPFPMSFHP